MKQKGAIGMVLEIVEKYLLIFFVYAFLGWLMEVMIGIITTKKFVNRGFLIGPYCPVYGIGVCLLTVSLNKYINDIPVLFLMSIFICGSLEYFTSYIMEKVFKARWWDYHNRKFNINGRICLETLIPFGIIGVLLIKFVNPLLLQLLNFSVLKWILLILCIIFMIDLVFSFKTILKFKKETNDLERKIEDNTEEISLKVKTLVTTKYTKLKENMTIKALELEVQTNKTIENVKNRFALEKIKQIDATKLIREKLNTKSWTTKRLVNAFPNFEIVLKDIKIKNIKRKRKNKKVTK